MGRATKRVTAAPRPAGRPPWASPGADDLDRVERPARRASDGQGVTKYPAAWLRAGCGAAPRRLKQDRFAGPRDPQPPPGAPSAARVGVSRCAGSPAAVQPPDAT